MSVYVELTILCPIKHCIRFSWSNTGHCIMNNGTKYAKYKWSSIASWKFSGLCDWTLNQGRQAFEGPLWFVQKYANTAPSNKGHEMVEIKWSDPPGQYHTKRKLRISGESIERCGKKLSETIKICQTNKQTFLSAGRVQTFFSQSS